MTENGEHEHVSLDKSAEILQAHFKHYFEMAMDHHTKASTTSNILLIVVGAIVTLIGIDNKVEGTNDFFGGLGVFVIGCFGAIWVWKQHERYHHWAKIAEQYQTELTYIVPMLKEVNLGSEYDVIATKYSKRKFGKFFAWEPLDRFLWVFLHCIVAFVGLAISIAVMIKVLLRGLPLILDI